MIIHVHTIIPPNLRLLFLQRVQKGVAVFLYCCCIFLGFCFAIFLGVLYKHPVQQKGQGTKPQSQREGESEAVTKGGSRKGIPLNEGEVGVRKVERRTIIETLFAVVCRFRVF